MCSMSASELHIDGSQLKKVDTFKYLGSHISANGRIDDKINHRVKQANRAYGRLSNRVFHSRNITLTTKVLTYNAVVFSSLLYGSETWTLYRHHLQPLENFHNASLRKILGITWKDKVPDTEVLRRTKSVSVENIVFRSHLRWLGHVIRMDDSRLPKQLLYGELSKGTRPVGRQQKRYRNQFLAVLKACHISSGNLEALAKDRAKWRETCRKGLQIRERDRTKWLEERRQKRKDNLSKAAQRPPSLFCNVCGRGCLSPIGLISHSRVHKKKQVKKTCNNISH